MRMNGQVLPNSKKKKRENNSHFFYITLVQSEEEALWLKGSCPHAERSVFIRCPEMLVNKYHSETKEVPVVYLCLYIF